MVIFHGARDRSSSRTNGIAAAHRECIPRIPARLPLHTRNASCTRSCDAQNKSTRRYNVSDACTRIRCQRTPLVFQRGYRCCHDTSSYIGRFTGGEGWKFRVETFRRSTRDVLNLCPPFSCDERKEEKFRSRREFDESERASEVFVLDASRFKSLRKNNG